MIFSFIGTSKTILKKYQMLPVDFFSLREIFTTYFYEFLGIVLREISEYLKKTYLLYL